FVACRTSLSPRHGGRGWVGPEKLKCHAIGLPSHPPHARQHLGWQYGQRLAGGPAMAMSTCSLIPQPAVGLNPCPRGLFAQVAREVKGAIRASHRQRMQDAEQAARMVAVRMRNNQRI